MPESADDDSKTLHILGSRRHLAFLTADIDIDIIDNDDIDIIDIDIIDNDDVDIDVKKEG